MKKAAIALGCFVTFTATAQAQSSVTLYGLVDDGFNWTSNAGGRGLYNLSSGVMQGSRWGLRGTEDLGGSFKAIFVLENGFDINSGSLNQKNIGSTQGLLFGRQAYVGLSSDFGTVTFGRQYDSVVDYIGQFEAGTQWGGYVASHPGDLDNFNDAYRVNNAIKFTSINYGGLRFGAVYSLGGVAGDTTRNQFWSVGANYVNGSLSFGAAYLNARNPNAGFFGDNGASTAASPSSNYAISPVYSGYVSAHTYQVIGGGAAYAIGAATVGLTYSNIQFRGLGDTTTSGPNPVGYRGNATFNSAEANFKYQFTPFLVAGVAFDYTQGNGASTASGTSGRAKYYQGSLGVDYFLSKRTDLYFIGVYQKASGTDSTGASAVADITNLARSTSDRQTTLRVGIRHKF
ncbi:porin [Burkholderia plantarii]|uniref:porin n=1 Tax=Burkholderia plantarii TaxID=41899 RepID=UPI0006D8B96B|nr:porin [Burkholderia plantarii]ALK35262.1 outer membrane porin OpcP [Burkholderia plantarii]WLE64224.1 porin [Burkholderia plantarii]GLZ23245.1 porin [Burkholderia plantarii]